MRKCLKDLPATAGKANIASDVAMALPSYASSQRDFVRVDFLNLYQNVSNYIGGMWFIYENISHCAEDITRVYQS